MHRTAQPSPFARSLVLRDPMAHVNILLPDCIRFFYPNERGQATIQEVDANTLGENAHGICFLTGTQAQAEREVDIESDREAIQPTVTAAFRMNAIIGLITRMANGEQLSVREWEQRVRRRFAMDCKIDALPLSTMLISVRSRNSRNSESSENSSAPE
jgi:hypothetical protein